MEKRNLIIDVARCENCHNCSLATKDEHIGNTFPGYAASQPLHGHDWIHIKRRVRGEGVMVDAAYLPTMCNHCDNAPCIAASGGDGSVYKRDDGIVIVDPEKARGRRDLVDSCPYGAMWWNEELEVPQIWIFDAHLLDQGWDQPRCQQSCPTGAITMWTGPDDAMARKKEEEQLQVLSPELDSRPRVYYRNLHRFDKEFIGGTVTAVVDGVEDCVAGARVTLSRGGAVLAETETDLFGNFKFDGLEGGGSSFEVDVDVAGRDSLQRSVTLEQGSRYLGVMTLADCVAQA